jgi:hypothetical protein
MVRLEANQPRQTRQWLLVFLCLPALALGQPKLIDRSVALIDGRVLTLSELQFEARVLLIHGGGVEAAFRELDQTTLRSVLDSVIGQRLEIAEADQLKAYPLEEGELQRAMDRFSLRLGGPEGLEAFLKANDADASALALVLSRMLRTERVFEGKFKLKAQVSEAEAKNLQSERPDLKGLALPALRQKLYNERFKALAAAELAQVRKAGSVRLLGPFAERLDGERGAR